MSNPSDEPIPSAGAAGACPGTSDLAILLREDAPLENFAADRVAAHIEACPACQRRLGELAGHGKWLDSLASGDAVTRPAVRAAAHAEPELRALIDQLQGQRPPVPASAADDVDDDHAHLAFLSPPDHPGYVGRLGQYQVIEIVGRGGMGLVLKAHDPSLARLVAIKVMAPALAASQTARKRFVREARAAAAISHEHVVTIHAVDEARGLPYIVMQFVAGRSLDARIDAAGGPLPVGEAARIGSEAAAGLAAAHAQGVVHRDVKPANIMLEDAGGRVKLTDFGLAHAADEASVTLTGQVSGTPSFMAPEQARGERVDARADLFSLGCVLYTMCAGRPPFAAPTPLAALRAVCDDEPPPLREVNADVPEWLADLVNALLHKDPAQRPSSAQDVADVLARGFGPSRSPGTRTFDAASGGSRIDAGSAGTASARRESNPRRLAVAVGVALLLLGLLALTEISGATRVTGWFGNAAVRPDSTVSPSSLTAANADDVAAGGYALLPGEAGGRPRAFASLADAVAAARHGDSIEIRTNDRVPTARVDVGRKALRIRAGDGFRPTLAQAGDRQAILTTVAPIVLEGLTFDGTAGTDAARARGDDPGECLVVAAGGATVYVTNCRFVVRGAPEARFGCLRVADSPACEVRNTEVHALQAMGVQWLEVPAGGGTLRLENVVQSGRLGLMVGKGSPGRAGITVDSGTFLVQSFVALMPGERPPTDLSVRVGRSVVATVNVRQDMSPVRREDRFAGVEWTDTQVVYDLLRPRPPAGAAGPPSAEPDWPGDGPSRGAFWGQVRFAGDFRRMQGLDDVPDPADFTVEAIRLPGGRMAPPRLVSNAGANIPLVGPGPAYEAFRKSSAYALWRGRTDDALRATPAQP